MSNPTSEPKYFKKHDYINLKKLFRSYVNINWEDEVINNFIVSKSNEIKSLKLPEISIRYLRQHLANGNVPYHYGKGDICSYINFWLNREIRSFNNLNYESNFNLFKEFEKKYSKDVLGKVENGCNNIINYIDPDTYERMETIYKMYELYDELTSTEIKMDDRCKAFGNIISLYNNALEKYDNENRKDYNLIKILFDLKNLTVKSNLPPDNVCQYRKYEFHEPKLYLKRLQEDETKRQEEEKFQKQKEQEEEKLQKQKEQEVELQRQKQQEKEELQKSQKLLQAEELDIKEPLRNGETVLSESLTHQNEREQSFGAEYPGVEGYIIRQGFSRPFFSEQQKKIDGRHPEFNDNNMDTSTTSGITGAIKDTFTTIVENVEPGPVLGVSGGMGVLFILFKVFKVLKL
ncbi:hypothetical protein PVMG_05583 [Plasmodium vivax Mauritania I]|uniref:VIR protein n=1 Tax=Plasmodium vivax Mauritania I TaxID=1035515 RepID=A0A0J9TIZ8_PLAVI|nr:hypothetical protein PVMG_05583 [Plasmodium vivax Mauritania I]